METRMMNEQIEIVDEFLETTAQDRTDRVLSATKAYLQVENIFARPERWEKKIISELRNLGKPYKFLINSEPVNTQLSTFDEYVDSISSLYKVSGTFQGFITCRISYRQRYFKMFGELHSVCEWAVVNQKPLICIIETDKYDNLAKFVSTWQKVNHIRIMSINKFREWIRKSYSIVQPTSGLKNSTGFSLPRAQSFEPKKKQFPQKRFEQSEQKQLTKMKQKTSAPKQQFRTITDTSRQKNLALQQLQQRQKKPQNQQMRSLRQKTGYTPVRQRLAQKYGAKQDYNRSLQRLMQKDPYDQYKGIYRAPLSTYQHASAKAVAAEQQYQNQLRQKTANLETDYQNKLKQYEQRKKLALLKYKPEAVKDKTSEKKSSSKTLDNILKKGKTLSEKSRKKELDKLREKLKKRKSKNKPKWSKKARKFLRGGNDDDDTDDDDDDLFDDNLSKLFKDETIDSSSSLFKEIQKERKKEKEKQKQRERLLKKAQTSRLFSEEDLYDLDEEEIDLLDDLIRYDDEDYRSHLFGRLAGRYHTRTGGGPSANDRQPSTSVRRPAEIGGTGEQQQINRTAARLAALGQAQQQQQQQHQQQPPAQIPVIESQLGQQQQTVRDGNVVGGAQGQVGEQPPAGTAQDDDDDDDDDVVLQDMETFY